MKNNFIKSTFILLLGGIITKLLGMIIRISMTRIIGLKGISLYSLILPTFSLFITIGQIGLPITLSRLVALKDRNNKNLYYTIIPFILLFNILLSLLIILSSNWIGINLLKNSNTVIIIKAIALVIPFTSISAIIRSYFFGKEKMFPHTLSNIIENITRLGIILFLIPKILYLKTKTIVFYIVLSNILSEGISILVLILFLPKKINIKELSFEKYHIKDSLYQAIPNISSNLIGNISYFLEPILLTFILTKKRYTTFFITTEYGIINGYVIPLLLIPSFFSLAISQSIMPHISRLYKEKNYLKVKKLLKQVLLLLLVFAITITIILELYGNTLLQILYKTTLGNNYLKFLAPFFIIHYLEHPLLFCIHALGKTKDLLKQSLISSSLKIINLIVFSTLLIGIKGYLVAMILNIIINTAYLFYKTNYYLK